MKSVSCLCATLLLALCGCAHTAVAEDAALAAEWRELRQVAGHHAGGPWRQDLDAWQGRKHQLMQSLAERLLAEKPDAAGVRALMGEPDRRVAAGAAEHADWLRRTQWQGEPDGELWSYHWRGDHDQLLVAMVGGRVGAVGWLYAWE
ncbi:hypothetical protein AAFN46_07820 [Pseudomonas sp. CAU 1711]|uniref:hypothetical protein n=1 Tax=Pseudomonas sp. CAU 1711 TaxID=3140356 RepID=UPI003260AA5C